MFGALFFLGLSCFVIYSLINLHWIEFRDSEISMERFIAFIYEFMVPMQQSKLWSPYCQFAAGVLLTLLWGRYFLVIMPELCLHILRSHGVGLLNLLSVLTGFIIVPGYSALLTFIFFCGLPKDSSNYLFEYKSPRSQSKLAKSWRIGSSLFVVALWHSLFDGFPLTLTRERLLEFLSTETPVLICLGLMPIFIFFFVFTLRCCNLIHQPFLVVRVLQNRIFLRRYAKVVDNRRHIPMYWIKNVSAVTHTEREFMNLRRDYYSSEVYSDDSSLYLVSPSPNYLRAWRGADMELFGGGRFFVGFKGVEEFVEVMNSTLAADTAGQKRSNHTDSKVWKNS